ncbi:MAG: hypothetical protein ACRD6U_00285 [Nitrososphaeraceae archaeon]
MSSTKKDNIKENTNQFKENTDRYLEQQRQQFKETASNLSNTTEKINENVNKFQDDNRRIFEKNAESLRKNQEQINKTIQEISNNAIELQKNVLDTYQSAYAQFWDNIKNNNSYWKNFNIPQRYSETSDTLDAVSLICCFCWSTYLSVDSLNLLAFSFLSSFLVEDIILYIIQRY